jgi:phosphoribosylformylglycinamidine cyclo-ligase
MPIAGRLHALAQNTGCGIPFNLSLGLPDGFDAIVERMTWELPPLFALLQRAGGVAEGEMRVVFYCGGGVFGVLPASQVEAARAAAAAAGDETWLIGEVRPGSGAVQVV